MKKTIVIISILILLLVVVGLALFPATGEGLSGLLGAQRQKYRKFISYIDGNNHVFFKLLGKKDDPEIKLILETINKYVYFSSLTRKHYTKFIGYEIDFGELVIKDFRIFVTRDRDNFILLHLFRKTTNKTPTNEKEIGYKRAKQYWENR